MRKICTTNRFERDLKRMKKRGKDVEKLLDIAEKLNNDEQLEAKHRPHALVGNWEPFWELHIEADWLLIYEVTEEELWLYRTGTHSDLFKKIYASCNKTSYSS